MRVMMLNKGRSCGLWSENALDGKPQKQNAHRDEFEGKRSMFIYIYQSFNPGKNRPVNRIAAVMMGLKSNTSNDDEAKLKHTLSHIGVHEDLWVVRDVEKARVVCQFPLHPTCSSFSIPTWLLPLRVQHLFMRRTTHRQTEAHPPRLFYSVTANMAQEQSQELPVEQRLSNSTEGDTEVKPSAACYSLINHLRATAHHIQHKIKVKTCWLLCTNYQKNQKPEMQEG